MPVKGIAPAARAQHCAVLVGHSPAMRPVGAVLERTKAVPGFPLCWPQMIYKILYVLGVAMILCPGTCGCLAAINAIKPNSLAGRHPLFNHVGECHGFTEAEMDLS